MILILIAQGRIVCDTLGGTYRTPNIITRFCFFSSVSIGGFRNSIS